MGEHENVEDESEGAGVVCDKELWWLREIEVEILSVHVNVYHT